MINNIQLRCYHWFFITVFAIAPFFMPSLGAESAVNANADHQNNEVAAIGVGFQYGRGRHYNRPYRYRSHPRYRYRYGAYPYYRNNYYPYYYDYDNYYYRRHPRHGGGVYFQIR